MVWPYDALIGPDLKRIREGKMPGQYLTVRVHRTLAILAGEEPPERIDHRNGKRSDNEAPNLRPATRQQNAFNAKRYASKSKLPRGVWAIRRKGPPRYTAVVTLSGRQEYLGSFDTVEGASSAVETHLRAAHGEFYRNHTEE